MSDQPESRNGTDVDRRVGAIKSVEDNTSTEPGKFALLAIMVLFGPFAIPWGIGERDVKLILWGVGTSLLYLSIVGLIFTVSITDVMAALGLSPYIPTIVEYGGASISYAEFLLSTPETYLALFAVALPIIAVGSYYVIKGDGDLYVR